MFRKFIGAALLGFLACWTFQPAFAQVGGLPQRNKTKQPNNNRQPERKQPQGPLAEDILKLLFTLENSFPNDNFQADAAPRRPQQARVLSMQEVSQIPLRQQRMLLRKAVQSIDEEFTHMKNGAGWRKLLQVEKLGSKLWCGQSILPDPKTRATLGAIADRFDKIAESSEYKTVTTLWGFQTIRSALREYAIEPIELRKRQVHSDSRALLRSLDNLTTAASWKKYLQTDEMTRLAQSKTKLASGDGDVLRKIVEQFRKVDKNPKYSQVARLNGFAATSRSLEKLANEVMQLKSRPSAANARRMLKGLSASLRVVNKTGKEKSAALKAWEKAAAGSPEADTARKVLMAIKQNHDKQKKLSREQIDRLRRFIAQTIKENKAKSPGGTATVLPPEVTVLPLEDNDADRKQMLTKLVANMRAFNKISKEKSAAQKAWEKAADGLPKADAARKILMAIKQNHDKQKKLSREQINRLRRFIARTIKENNTKSPEGTVTLLPLEDDDGKMVTLMQFHDAGESCEGETVTLMQFNDDDSDDDSEEEPTYVLMQFKEATETKPEEVTLMQFREATDNEPEEVMLMQFRDLQDSKEKDEAEEEETDSTSPK